MALIWTSQTLPFANARAHRTQLHNDWRSIPATKIRFLILMIHAMLHLPSSFLCSLPE